jgi:hypothetical protein
MNSLVREEESTNQQNNRPVDVVILVHGIRDYALWQSSKADFKATPN